MQQDTAVGIRVNPGRKNTVKLSTVPAPHVFARMGAHTNVCARAHTHTHIHSHTCGPDLLDLCELYLPPDGCT